MSKLLFRVPRSTEDPEQLEKLLSTEWLVTNGLGGYSSNTVCGLRTRRYHGLLVAALPAPLGRVVMLNELAEQVQLPDGERIRLDAEFKVGSPIEFHGRGFIVEFRLELGLPIWLYEIHGFILEKRLVLPHMQNSVHVIYKLLEGEGKIRLRLRPAVKFRQHELPVDAAAAKYAMTILEDRYELSAQGIPPLRFMMYGHGAQFTFKTERVLNSIYWMEERRGFFAKSDLWSPGHFHMDLMKGESASLVAGTHSWETMTALAPVEAMEAEVRRREHLISLAMPAARQGKAEDLVLAADQFIIRPLGRPQDTARARAAGYEMHSVIAGYHWFTDWGRDTMISLEGLTLVTGRYVDAGSILQTFGHYVRDGLIPNMFPEGEKEGLYHTADASLWFFHAIERYLSWTNEIDTLELLLPKLKEIVEFHLEGTRFNIKVDSEDGLLEQGQDGYQLTWMDAKVENWVVTPRRGKAVEINALWYNALRLLEKWSIQLGDHNYAKVVGEHAHRTYESFNKKFWYESEGYLYDIIDGETGCDSAIRPNQVFSISLDFPVLDETKWASVMNVVSECLVTPLGLRSLAPGHPDFKPKYYGDLRSRDAAYHQGTVWAWLIGPFIDAWLKVYPGKRKEARRFLDGLLTHGS